MKNIKAFIQKYRQKLVIVSTVILAIIGISNLYYNLKVNPMSNDECLWVPHMEGKDVVIYFDKVKHGGVAWNAGIRNGDRLVAINHVKITNTPAATSILNKFRAGQYAPYTYERQGQKFETKVYVKKLISFSNLGFSLLGLIWLFVGFVVIMAKPNGYVQRLFYRVGALFVLSFTFSFLSSESIPGSLSNVALIPAVIDFVWTYSAYLLSFTIIYLFWHFPKPFKGVDKVWVRRLFFIVPTFFFIISYLYRILFVYLPGNPENYKYVMASINICIFTGLGIGLFSLFISYRRLKTKSEKKPVFIILVGFILGAASILYTLTIATVIADTIFNSPEYFMPIVLVVLIPVSFGYSIFKYQLMDVSIVVKNTIIYGTATAALAAIYFLTVYVLGQGIGEVVGTENRSFIAAGAFVVFALVFQSTRDRFQDLLTRKFYPEQFAYQKVILKFGHDVVSIVGLDNILDSMRDTFVNSLRLEHFAILLNDDDPHIFDFKRGTGLNGAGKFNISDKSLRLTHYIREQILLQGQITIERQQFMEIFPKDYPGLEAANIYTVIPMIIKSKTIGLLAFGLKHSGSQFAGKDLVLLCAAANQAAVAIENARLYEFEAQRLAVQRDLENARKIQESLLPKALPQIPCFEVSGKMISAMQVGGDYYDLIQVSPLKMFAVVGDVSGKGLSASLYMSKLQTMMRLYCTEGKTPREILIEINKRIYEEIERSWFITATLILFDAEKGEVKFCRAGHSQMLDICRNNVNVYQPKGIGLGLEEGKVFQETLEEVTLPLEAGHIYAVYSDGVSEAMDENNELFGTEQLARSIMMNQNKNAEEIVQGVLDSLSRFRGKREQNDDITLVLVKSR
ncbi:MAG TPA: SpoIIE family protein phosphatase [Ignavibacteriales bacterium]|nr:SpoIIE family protein phosphatase [Ignavibacteriales bacterium]